MNLRTLMKRGVYDINHIYALRIKNTSESDPRSYEATKAVAKKSPETIMRQDLRDTGVRPFAGLSHVTYKPLHLRPGTL